MNKEEIINLYKKVRPARMGELDLTPSFRETILLFAVVIIKIKESQHEKFIEKLKERLVIEDLQIDGNLSKAKVWEIIDELNSGSKD